MPDVRSLVRQDPIPTIVVRPPGRGGTQAQPLQPGITSDLPPGWASPTLAQPQQPTVASDLPAGWGGPGQTQAQPQRAAVGSDLPPGWGGPTPEVTGASPPAKPPPVDAQPANSGNQPASTQPGSTTQTPSQTPSGTNSPVGDDFRTQVDKQVQDNCLNGLYQPTYHFRLFIGSELDLAEATSTSDIGSLINNLQKVKQVIIAESGVTGYTIREVEINTIATQNAATRDQKATTFTVTVTEPMGISFLDALANAAGYLGIKDWTKVTYYLQLSFTGYKADGSFAGNPVFTGFKNGGQWLWGLTITTIDTKVNEGGGVYTISMVTSETESVLIESKKFTTPKTAITAEGSTLGELFDDYVKKLNQSWTDNFKKEQQTDSPLYEYHIITHPVTFGTYNGRDPKKFKLQPQKKDTSPIRWQAMDSKQKWTAHIGPETSVNDFIISAIKATEEGQELFKNESVKDNIDQTDTSTNSQRFRVSTAFSIEPLISYKRMDGNSGNYTKKVDIHVTPYSTQGIIASRTQVKDAEDPAVQREMINDLVKKGLLKKRYDYIFTGMNTEIIDFDIKFNMAWQAVLAKLAGKRIGYASEAIAARITTDGTSPSTQPQDDASIVKENKLSTVGLTGQPNNSSEGTTQPTAPQPAPGMALSTAQQALEPVGNLGLVRDPATGRVFTPGGGGLAMAPSPTGPTQPSDSMVQYPALTDAMSRIRSSVAAAENAPGWAGKFLTDKFSQSAGQPSKPAQPAPAPSNVMYMEDIVSRMAQGQKLNRSILPISFSYHNQDTKAASGTGLAGQDHRGMSVMGMAVQLFSTPDITGSFQTVDLTIKGDPFWLGQSNYERRFALMAGKTLDPSDIPDYSSARPCIQLYFKYPLTIGDDFKPVLHDSECFNGIYEVTVVKHAFSEGSFKQTLTAIRYPLISPSVAFSNDPGSTANSNSGSSANGDAVPGSNKPGSGNTPGTGTSNPGDTRGFNNKNPMNLQYVDGQPGVTGQDGRFGQYASMEDGIAASMNQLLINQNEHNLTTIATQIADPVHGWTPAKDNSVALTNGSINGLSQSLGISPTDPLDLNNPATAQKFIDTKIKQENSKSVDSSVIAAGVAKGIAYYNSRHH